MAGSTGSFEDDDSDYTDAKSAKTDTTKQLGQSEFNQHLLGHIKKKYSALASDKKSDYNFFDEKLSLSKETKDVTSKTTPNESKVIPYFVIENLKTGSRFVIFNVTKDASDLNRIPELSYSADVIDAYLKLPQEKEEKSRLPKEYSTLLLPIRQSQTTFGHDRAHIVLAEIPLNEDKNIFSIHDSQGAKSKLYENVHASISALRKRLGKTDFVNNTYDKQKQDFECGFYVYRYIDAILSQENSDKLKDIIIPPEQVANKDAFFTTLADSKSNSPSSFKDDKADPAKAETPSQQKDYQHPAPAVQAQVQSPSKNEPKPDDKEEKQLAAAKTAVLKAIKTHYEDQKSRHHDARVADLKNFINQCEKIADINMVLDQQEGLYDPKRKFNFGKGDANTLNYPSLFKHLSWFGSNKGKYYNAIQKAREALNPFLPKVEENTSPPNSPKKG